MLVVGVFVIFFITEAVKLVICWLL